MPAIRLHVLGIQYVMGISYSFFFCSLVSNIGRPCEEEARLILSAGFISQSYEEFQTEFKVQAVFLYKKDYSNAQNKSW